MVVAAEVTTAVVEESASATAAMRRGHRSVLATTASRVTVRIAQPTHRVVTTTIIRPRSIAIEIITMSSPVIGIITAVAIAVAGKLIRESAGFDTAAFTCLREIFALWKRGCFYALALSRGRLSVAPSNEKTVLWDLGQYARMCG